MSFGSLTSYLWPRRWILRISMGVGYLSLAVMILGQLVLRREWPSAGYSLSLAHSESQLSWVWFLLLIVGLLLSLGALALWRTERARAVMPLVVWVIAAFSWLNLARLPSDAVLSQRFQEHRAVFERLARMATEDAPKAPGGVGALAVGTTPEPDSSVASFGTQRYQDYQRIFAELGLRSGFTMDSGRVVAIVEDVAGTGSLDMKGYLWSTGRPIRVERSLGDRCGANRTYLVSELGSGWYLFRYCS